MSSLEPLKYNYLGQIFDQQKKKSEQLQAKKIFIKIYKSIDKNEKVLEIFLKPLNCYKKVTWDNCNYVFLIQNTKQDKEVTFA